MAKAFEIWPYRVWCVAIGEHETTETEADHGVEYGAHNEKAAAKLHASYHYKTAGDWPLAMRVRYTKTDELFEVLIDRTFEPVYLVKSSTPITAKET
jgi:hypothetical protein